MKSRLVLCALAMMVIFGSAPGRLWAQSQTVLCASDDMERHICPADTRGGVLLSRQISGSSCTQGTSWGYDTNGIWVDKGCRAEFQVMAAAPAATQAQTVACASDDMERQYCAADTRGGVQLSRQISGSPCTQGSTWGYDSGGIWVDKGCRAEFAVGAAYAGGTQTQAGAAVQTVLCASDDMGRHSCPADTRGGVRLSRQISGSPCTQGTTWGYDASSIWVDRGCRAEFQVGSAAGVSAGTVPVSQGASPCGSSSLVSQLSQGLNITPQQAQGGAGALFALAQSRLSAQDFSQVAAAVPEMNGMLQAAPSAGPLSAFGGWSSVVGVFQKLGLTPDMVVKFVPVLVNYVRCRGGSGTASLLGKTLQ